MRRVLAALLALLILVAPAAALAQCVRCCFGGSQAVRASADAEEEDRGVRSCCAARRAAAEPDAGGTLRWVASPERSAMPEGAASCACWSGEPAPVAKAAADVAALDLAMPPFARLAPLPAQRPFAASAKSRAPRTHGPPLRSVLRC